MITDTQSYSLVLRDMFFDKLAAAPYFATFTKRKSSALQIQPQNLPYLGVYLGDEGMTTDGEGNQSYIRFTHTLRIMFSVKIVNNDPDDCERKLDQAFWAICNTLWRDPYLTNMLDTTPYGSGMTGTPDNTRFESIQRGMRRHRWGATALDNETPLGELEYDVSIVYRSEFAPVIADDLLQISLTTGVKPGETPEEMAKRLQAGHEYFFEPEP